MPAVLYAVAAIINTVATEQVSQYLVYAGVFATGFLIISVIVHLRGDEDDE